MLSSFRRACQSRAAHKKAGVSGYKRDGDPTARGDGALHQPPHGRRSDGPREGGAEGLRSVGDVNAGPPLFLGSGPK